MPRKTRRRIRRKRVRGTKKVNGTKRVNGTRRVRIYYRGGNRRYNGEGGHWLSDKIGDMFGSTNLSSAVNSLGTTASSAVNSLGTTASNVANSLGTTANSAVNSLGTTASNVANSLGSTASTYLNPKTYQTPSPPFALTTEEKSSL